MSNMKEKPEGYKKITDDDLYRHSSQYRLWSFTPLQLEQARLDINEQATRRTEQDLLTYRQQNAEALTKEDLSLLEEKARPISMQEELNLVNFYAKKVQVIAQHLNLPTEVIATSIIFFRRFFLANSVMEVDPKSIVHTTIFLACKSENFFISVDTFAKKAKATKEAILNNEFKLLESLKFSLLNHHPYRPLHGFFLDIQNLLHGKVDTKYMGQIYENCKRRITDALLTDAVFFYTPPQITLAALLIEDEALTSKYLETKFGPQKEPEEDNVGEEKPELAPQRIDYDTLLQVILSCQTMIQQHTVISTDEAKSIATKVYFSKNPQSLVEKARKRESSANNGEEPLKRRKTEGSASRN